jgi:hypothetical protein
VCHAQHSPALVGHNPPFTTVSYRARWSRAGEAADEQRAHSEGGAAPS